MKKLLKFLQENTLWFIFIILFSALFLINILVPNIEAISWLNTIVKSPFILMAGITILIGVFKTSIIIANFFKCDNVYLIIPIFIFVAFSLIIAFQML